MAIALPGIGEGKFKKVLERYCIIVHHLSILDVGEGIGRTKMFKRALLLAAVTFVLAFEGPAIAQSGDDSGCGIDTEDLGNGRVKYTSPDGRWEIWQTFTETYLDPSNPEAGPGLTHTILVDSGWTIPRVDQVQC